MIRVTVAIPTYNRAACLRQTLDGACRQDFPANEFEILVIDNNSTDDTKAVVAEFAGRFPEPRYVQESKQGLDHARNRAVAEARGNIILFADDDILVEPDWVRRMAEPFGADDHIGAAGGEVTPVFPDGLPPWIVGWHAPQALRASAGPLAMDRTPMGANLAIRKSVFDRLGLFRAELDREAGSYFSGGDAEMVRRIQASGWEIWFVPEAAVRHQIPASRTTFRYAARHAFDSARSRVIERAGQPGAKTYLSTRLVVNAAKAAGFSALAILYLLSFQAGTCKKSLVRAWRSCGYVYQAARSLRGRR
jgi:glycosyltransferase involved in cell wall biosynthesis